MGRVYEHAVSVQTCIHDPSRACTNCVRWLNLDHGQTFDLKHARSELDELFRKRYHSRVWVLQEVALARIAMLVMNGVRVTLSPQQLSRLIRGCRNCKLRIPGPLNWARAGARQLSLGVVSWLRISWLSRCHDPRDKVYAILSLIELSLGALIPVDSVSIDMVISNDIFACIAETQSLDILSLAFLRKGEDAVDGCILRVSDFERYLNQGTHSPGTLASAFPFHRTRVHVPAPNTVDHAVAERLTSSLV